MTVNLPYCPQADWTAVHFFDVRLSLNDHSVEALLDWFLICLTFSNAYFKCERIVHDL